MKQTEKFSIGGYAFILEKEAVAEVESYINDMGSYYSNPEVIDGIEERMAELLRERTPEGGVVSKATVLSIIDILGRPERIAQDDPEEESPRQNDGTRPAKKLYRDMQNARFAGVCSGLGAYFKVDTAIFRLAFTLLTIVGFVSMADKNGVISLLFPTIYIILWICMPAAKTAQQRWEMNGDDGTTESIRRNIESGAAEVRSAVRQVGNAPVWSPIGRAIEIIVGIMLLLVSVAGLFAGGLAVFGWEWLGWSGIINEIITEITEELPQILPIMDTLWVKILSLTVYTLPFIGMLYASIMMLFRIKSPSWHPGLLIFVIWLMAIVAFAILLLATIIPTEMV